MLLLVAAMDVSATSTTSRPQSLGLICQARGVKSSSVKLKQYSEEATAPNPEHWPPSVADASAACGGIWQPNEWRPSSCRAAVTIFHSRIRFMLQNIKVSKSNKSLSVGGSGWAVPPPTVAGSPPSHHEKLRSCPLEGLSPDLLGNICYVQGCRE